MARRVQGNETNIKPEPGPLADVGKNSALSGYDPKRLRKIPLRELEYLIRELEESDQQPDDEAYQQMMITIREEIERRRDKRATHIKHDVPMYG